ncbi:CCN family member 1 [Piliocolobus tephrosceles]|uniref:CCN family member 1 n=1 Tax=Piliocolobus tephrosceles TaxID=591936 RepID=UPI000C2AF8EC|nr:CCN family member 1 [Piliocolobus tephrosceles]
MSSRIARALALAVTLLHLIRMVSWTLLLPPIPRPLSVPFPGPRLPTAIYGKHKIKSSRPFAGSRSFKHFPPSEDVSGPLGGSSLRGWPGWTKSEAPRRQGRRPPSFPAAAAAPLLRTAPRFTRFFSPFQALSTCPAACHCPLEAPKCAPGVGLVRDGCGCCKVCAKQLNEDCSKTQPCDHTKGLECNFGASSTALKGICRAQSEGRPCEYNSRIYQNGESFQPNCKHQCTCIDGAVGCIPLCPQELSLPNLGCPNPRLVKVTGQCCEEWVCDEDSVKDPMDDQEGLLGKELGFDASEVELTRNNELIAVGKGSSLKRLPVFGMEPRILYNPLHGQKCIVQTTSWSQCSKTCGTGISTRVTNDNPECRLVKETRICEVRPCGQPVYSSLKKGKKCSKTKKSPEPVRFTYAGCSSVKKYRPKYCGSCVDGRCCTPQLTRTVKMRFRCEDGETFSKNVMMIQSCKCNYNCPHASEAAFPFYRLFNDIHKFRD